MSERIRIENRTFVARTLAATIAGMSYGYFCRLCAQGKGPSGHILVRDAKQFFPIANVRQWAKLRPWATPNPKPAGRKRVSDSEMMGIELYLPRPMVETIRARHGNISAFARQTFEQVL